MPPQSNLKMGITPAGRAKVIDSAAYSVGDLLLRALTGRDFVRWSDFIMQMRANTKCLPEHIMTLEGFMMTDAPFLGALGLIDPRAIEETVRVCGGLPNMRHRAYNVNMDPRQATDRQRLVRNRRYVFSLIRRGTIGGERGMDIDKVLSSKIPVTGDRVLIRRLIVESGFNGGSQFNKAIFEKKVADLGFKDIERGDWDLGFILAKELGQSVTDTAIQAEGEQHQRAAESAAPIAPRASPRVPAPVPVAIVAAPVVCEEPAPVVPVQIEVKVEEPPVTPVEPVNPPPAPVTVVPEVKKKPGVQVVITRAVAYRAFVLMAKVLTEEHGWPFGNVLPNVYIHPIIKKVWPYSAQNPAVNVNAIQKARLLKPNGKLGTGYLWEIQDVKLYEWGDNCPEVSIDDVRKFIAEETMKVPEVIQRIRDQNPALRKERSKPAPVAVVPEPVLTVADPSPSVAIDTAAEATLAPVLVAPVVETQQPAMPVKTLEELFAALTPAERYMFVEQHLRADVASLATAKLKGRLTRALKKERELLKACNARLAEAKEALERAETDTDDSFERVRILERMLEDLK